MKQYVLITGASTGIGYASAQKFIEEGYFVFGSVRKDVDAQRLAQDFGANFQALIFDVTDAVAIQKAFLEVEAIVGDAGLAILVNNAGLVISGPMQHLSLEDLDYQFEVNVKGVLRVTQTFLPLLGAQKPAKYPPGKILNISSVSGFITTAFLGPYAMSKYALESMSDALRRELIIYGIDVVIIEPGPIKTPIWNKAHDGAKDYPDTDYAKVIANFKRQVAKNEEKAMPVRQVAEVIYTAGTRKKAKTRYIVAYGKIKFWLVKHIIPDRFLDRMIKKSFDKAFNKE